MKSKIPESPCPVCIIDDDEGVRSALRRLLLAYGIHSEAFADAAAFLNRKGSASCVCVIADVKMKGMSGLQLQQHMLDHGHHIPFIYLTASEDAETRAEAKLMGSIAYFRKPVDDQALMDAISWALSGAKEGQA